MTKMVVCGGRDEHLTRQRRTAMLDYIAEAEVDEIVTGGCRGIDQEAEELAREASLKTTTFRPAWDTHGRAAGPLRNQEMAQYADICLAFPGGAGTENMKKCMRDLNKPVLEEK